VATKVIYCGVGTESFNNILVHICDSEYQLFEYNSVFRVDLGLDSYFLQYVWNCKSNILHSKLSFGAWTKR
jgi:hypothetical protein